MNSNEEESNLINPKDLLQKGQTKRKSIVEAEPEVDESPIEIHRKTEFKQPINTGGTVEILFESAGRFGNPEKLLIKDLLGEDVNDIITSKEDKILETTVSCLNKCVVYPEGFKIENLTNEEFFELLLGMKVAFDSVELMHKWYHSCQDNISNPKERKLSESPIDLRNIQTISIEQADENLREFTRSRFNEFSDEQFQTYLNMKYGSNISKTREQEIDDIKIKEPINIPGHEFTYQYSYMRIKYLIEAHRLASKEIDHLIRIENSRTIHGKSKEEMNATREEKVEELNREKAKKYLKYSQALCIVGKTNNSTGEVTVFKTVEEKINESKKIPRGVSLHFINCIDKTKYGVNHEIKLECNLCEGESNIERGYLQRIITPFELLPISDFKRDFTKRGLQQSSGLDFYF